MDKRKIPLITLVLVAVNIVCYAFEMADHNDRILYAYGMYQGAMQDGEWYRIITSAFLHFDLFHLGCNMLCLISFGLFLEEGMGRLKYGLIYGVSILGSGLLIQFAGGAHSLHAGASGAVWGLMGASLVYVIKYKGDPSSIIRSIALNLIYSFTAGVSWQGHIGGGIAGLIAALILLNMPNLPGNGTSYKSWKKSHPDVSDDFFYNNRR